MQGLTKIIALVALVAPLAGLIAQARAQMLIVANDEKLVWDDDGKAVNKPPGNDTKMILDIANRAKPRTVATSKLENTVVGPPTNLQITPDEHVAPVANSLHWIEDGNDRWKGAPDNKVYVLDLR